MADWVDVRRLLSLVLLLLVSCGRYSGPDDIAGMIRWDHAEGVQEWIDDGGDPNLVIDGTSLVYIACGPKGGVAVLKVLLDAGADASVGTDYGTTPLMNAASWASLEKCRLLVSHGADPAARRSDGRTAIVAAQRCSDSEAVVAYLESLLATNASEGR